MEILDRERNTFKRKVEENRYILEYTHNINKRKDLKHDNEVFQCLI